MPYYLNRTIDGIRSANSLGDGYSINVKWARAYPTTTSNSIGYNIYMSSGVAPVYTDSFFMTTPAFVYIGPKTNVDIVDLIPGQLYHFGVRAFEYDPSTFNISYLQSVYENLYTFPQSLLSQNISATDDYVPLLDVSEFDGIPSGTVKLGYELIDYSYVDDVNGLLGGATRGASDGIVFTVPAEHDVDGYFLDGYSSGYLNPYATLWMPQSEETNIQVYECWNRFDVGNYPYTTVDGYRQTNTDILTTNLEYSDAVNTGFPRYDFAGWHRTDPVLLLNGTCIGSYIGGYMFCADGYNSVGQQVRGLNIQQQNLQRQEVLLSTEGEPVCLMKRTWTGITCKCMLPYNENPGARCQKCFGTGFVVGWSQFFDPRQSDGRIMVRFDPSVDDLLPTDSGLESDFKPTCWTLAVPTLKDRDFLVRFDEDGEQEFRYEILNVTRNKLLLNQTGVQKFALQRIRKTDILYQVKAFYDTSMYPQTLTTSIVSSTGLQPHQHSWVLNEKPTIGATQLTGIAAGHNHVVYLSPQTGMLEVSEELGHTHILNFA